MNRIESTFTALRAENRKAFIPYLMAGDPDLKATASIIKLLATNGADLIEVGVPFSDPLADGPVIQQAGVRALQKGCTLDKLLEMLNGVSRNINTPLMLMIYYNMIYQRGLERFCREAAEAGCAGLIIPDLLPEAAGDMQNFAVKFGLGINFLVAPTSSDERIIQAAEASTGFLYAVSLKGVTGVRSSLPPELPQFVAKVNNLTSRPVAVGFGISTPEQAGQVAKLADGVIVGSAIVKTIAADPGLEALNRLTKEFRRAI